MTQTKYVPQLLALLPHIIRLLGNLFANMRARTIKNIVWDLGGVLIEWQPAKIVEGIFSERASQPLDLIEVLGSTLWRNMDR